MKTPININGNDLAAWLQSATQIRMADLYTITPVAGSVLRYTSWDSSLTVLGNIYLSGPPSLVRSRIEEKIGLEVTSLELEIHAGPDDLMNGSPALPYIAGGGLDGATLRIDRLFMDADGNQIGLLTRFSGMLGNVEEVGRSYARLTVNALVQLLNQPLPREILQPGCTNTLFDAKCGQSNPAMTRSNFAAAGTVQAGSTVNKLLTALTQPDSYFDNGQIVFAGGALAGLTKAIRQFSGGSIFFHSPLPAAPSAGDSFTCYPGCDKTQATCQAKFNNLPNFGGYPYVPAPETAI